MKAHVLGSGQFVCSKGAECRASHPGEFFEGQLHHVGSHYDLALKGKALRVVVVGQEYGNGPARVEREARTHDVLVVTGRDKRFRSDGTHGPRNPHMRGTTSLLRLIFDGVPGGDYAGEFLTLGGEMIHIFDAFALANFFLCSAIDSGQGPSGSKHGKATGTMQRNCSRHFVEAMRILEPTVMIAQGKGVRTWLNAVVARVATVGPNLESVALGNRHCLLATLTHPSVPSRDNWGTDERRPYLMEVVAPTVRSIHAHLLHT